MEKVEYTSEIVSLIQKGEKLEAIAEIRKNYSISLVEAKNMVNTYNNSSLKFEIKAKQFYAASQRVL